MFGLNFVVVAVLWAIVRSIKPEKTCYASDSSNTPWDKDTYPPSTYEDMSSFYRKIWVYFITISCFYWSTFLRKLFDLLVIILILAQIVVSLLFGFSHKSKVCYGGYDEAKDTDGNILVKY